MPQLLLFPDPRPLVERLGLDFFRRAPDSPGVYLMRDRGDNVLYVGKAKNLRRRLASYRVANPERLRARHLRLLRAVEHIELRPCLDEACALATESALLRSLRPRFNRAGTWPGPPRYLAWQLAGPNLKLAVMNQTDVHWRCHGPFGAAAAHVHAALARLLWCSFYPELGVVALPEGWFGGRHKEACASIPLPRSASVEEIYPAHLEAAFAGQPQGFCAWISERTAAWTHPFDLSVRDADLEVLTQMTDRPRGAAVPGRSNVPQRG